jgi:hypothetical protein
MLVTVIDEHLQQIDMVLDKVPVVVPAGNVQLALK